ncbi:MAG: hypothetical protein H7070_15025 [Saprospiraceae bacterium]|nr:hypothetical protein [Pyrinomonadaceae bacterium]
MTGAKRFFLAVAMILAVGVVTLSVITHSTFACADRIERSLLRIILEDIAKALFG